MAKFAVAVAALVAAGGATVYGAVEQHKARNDAKAQAANQLALQKEQQAKQEAAAAKQLKDAQGAKAAAEKAAADKADARRLAIDTGGRPSTFATDTFGLTSGAPVKKKKLGE